MQVMESVDWSIPNPEDAETSERASVLTPVTDDVMPLAQAAERIGISRRRAQDLIARGQLPARRSAGAWMVSAKAVRFANRVLRHSAGHPLSQAGAWEVIKYKLADTLGDPAGRDALRRRVRDRAAHHFDVVDVSFLDRIKHDPRTVVSGLHAVAIGEASTSPGTLDAYVRLSDLSGMREEYGCKASFDEANLFLHVVDDHAWPFEEDQVRVTARMAWLDLADQGDAAADVLLTRLLQAGLGD